MRIAQKTFLWIGVSGVLVALIGFGLSNKMSYAGPAFSNVFINGKLLESNESGTALGVSGDRIVAIGNDEALKSQCQSGCKIIDVGGSYILPGFHDAHAHQISGGASFFRLSVSGSSIASIVNSVKVYAKAHPELSWIRGRGWNAAGFGSKLPHP